MKKINLLLRFLPLCISNFRDLLKSLLHFSEEYYCKNKAIKFGFGSGLPVVDMLDVCPNITETIHNYTFLDGTSELSDIALLKAISKRYNPCDYLEIGVWRGESIVNIAEHAKNCTSLSLSATEMKEIGLNNQFIRSNQFFSKNIANIKHIEHNSQTFDFKSLNQKFDFIFVDGDHHYDAVVNDTRNVFQLLKNEQSIIVWHDYGYSPETIRWEILTAIIEGTPAEKRKHLYRVSNTLCAIFIQGNIPSKQADFPEIPNKVFTVNIKAEPVS